MGGAIAPALAEIGREPSFRFGLRYRQLQTMRDRGGVAALRLNPQDVHLQINALRRSRAVSQPDRGLNVLPCIDLEWQDAGVIGAVRGFARSALHPVYRLACQSV